MAHLIDFRHARKLLRPAVTLVGPALLLYFIATADLRLIWLTLRGANLWMVLAALLLGIPFFIFKAVRWRLILDLWQISLPLWEAVALVCVGQYAGTVTPGQTGDAVRAWYLRGRGHPLGIGLTSVVLDRLFDLAITLVLALVGTLLYDGLEQPGDSSLAWRAALLLAVLIGGFLLGRFATSRLPGRLATRLPRALRGTIERLRPAAGRLAPRHVLVIALVSAIALSWTYLRIYLLFRAVDTLLPLGPFILFVALLALVGPAAPGGVGTRDALLVVVLQTVLGMGHSAAVGRALALSALILMLNLANVVVGFLFSLRYPLPLTGPGTDASNDGVS